MPAIKQGNTYGSPLIAGKIYDSIAPSTNSSKGLVRVKLFIQNTGNNPMNVQFGKPVQGLLFGELELNAGESIDWHNPAPQENVSIVSALGSAYFIYEGLGVE